MTEEQAGHISMILNERSEMRLREAVADLTKTHAEQMDRLRKAGNRSSLIFFIGGVLLGVVGNVVVNVVML